MADSLPVPEIARHTLSVRAARNLAHTTKTVPQMAALTPRWMLHLLPWVNVEAGTYRVNRRRVVVGENDRIVIGVDGDKARIEPKHLRAILMLRNADHAMLESIAGLLVSERYDAQTEVYKEGDPSKKVLYVIVSGKVEITTTDPHGEKLRLALRGEGNHFGEKALIHERPRTTTVRTLTPSHFLTLDRAKFKAQLDKSPELRECLDKLCDRRDDGVKQNDHGEAGIDIFSYHDGEPELSSTFVDYEEEPREYQLSVMQTVLRLHTRITDLYNHPIDQLREQLRLTIEGMKERQESGILNDPEFGLLNAAAPSMRIPTRSGPPTPDDMDDLLAHVWKEPAFFLAHPRAIAAFGRECTRRGVPPPTVQMFGSPFLTWRGVPIVPTDKLLVKSQVSNQSAGTTNILLLRVGEQKQGVVGLRQTGLPGEQLPGLSVRFMGIDKQSSASYLVTMYFSAAVLTEDALAVLENVEVGNYHDCPRT